MKLRFVATVALLSLAVALLGACGSSGSASEDESAATQPSNQAEQDDQPEAEAAQSAEEEEQPVSACLEAPPSKTKFTVLAVDKYGFGEFKPKKLEVPAGKKITILYKNESPAIHDFVIDSLECDSGKVDKATVTFTAPSKPTEFRCTIHDFMTGKLIPVG